MGLIAPNVETLFRYCLYEQHELVDGQPPSDAVQANSVRLKVGFHPGRLEEKKPEIHELIAQLPDELTAGSSYLNLCMTKNDHQWGEQSHVSMLMCLGLAAGFVVELIPGEIMPDQMPVYMRVK